MSQSWLIEEWLAGFKACQFHRIFTVVVGYIVNILKRPNLVDKKRSYGKLMNLASWPVEYGKICHRKLCYLVKLLERN